MAHTNEKLQALKEIHSKEEAIYSERNEKYGDSFSTTFQKRGPISSLTRMEDKFSRADYMLSNGITESNGESVIDTLMDLSNYANMTIMELMASQGSSPQDPVKAPKKRKKAPSLEKDSQKPPKKEEGPFEDLTKKQLVEAVCQLGGSVPKKANREKLISTINEFPKAKVAVVLTSLKADPEGKKEDQKDGEE